MEISNGEALSCMEGMYNHVGRKIIFIVVNPRKLYMLEEYIHRIDSKVFIAVPNAYEILGKGFKSLSEIVDDK